MRKIEIEQGAKVDLRSEHLISHIVRDAIDATCHISHMIHDATIN